MRIAMYASSIEKTIHIQDDCSMLNHCLEKKYERFARTARAALCLQRDIVASSGICLWQVVSSHWPSYATYNTLIGCRRSGEIYLTRTNESSIRYVAQPMTARHVSWRGVRPAGNPFTYRYRLAAGPVSNFLSHIRTIHRKCILLSSGTYHVVKQSNFHRYICLNIFA